MDIKERVLFYLQEALAGTINRADFDMFVSKMESGGNTLLNEAVHALGHFLVDCDIRDSDKEYARLCREKLLEYIKQIGKDPIR